MLGTACLTGCGSSSTITVESGGAAGTLAAAGGGAGDAGSGGRGVAGLTGSVGGAGIAGAGEIGGAGTGGANGEPELIGTPLDVAEHECMAPVSAPTPPCPDMCGNQTVDSCSFPSGADGINVNLLSEECDGPSPSDVSCGTLGFEAGTLRCDETCRRDVSSCTVCASGSSEGVRCTERLFGLVQPDPYYFWSASLGERHALGYTSGFHDVRLAMVGGNLSVLSEHCYAIRSRLVGLVPNADGWLLALQASDTFPPSHVLLPVDGEGRPRGPANSIVAGNLPPSVVLVRGASGSHLLLVDDREGSLRAAAVDTRGAILWQRNLGPAWSGVRPAGVAVGNGYLVAAMSGTPENREFAVLPVAADGTVGPSIVAARYSNGWEPDNPRFATFQGEITLGWDEAGSLNLARLAPSGELLGQPVATNISGAQAIAGTGPAEITAIVALGDAPLEVRTIDMSGTTGGTTKVIARQPGVASSGFFDVEGPAALWWVPGSSWDRISLAVLAP